MMTSEELYRCWSGYEVDEDIADRVSWPCTVQEYGDAIREFLDEFASLDEEGQELYDRAYELAAEVLSGAADDGPRSGWVLELTEPEPEPHPLAPTPLDDRRTVSGFIRDLRRREALLREARVNATAAGMLKDEVERDHAAALADEEVFVARRRPAGSTQRSGSR